MDDKYILPNGDEIQIIYSPHRIQESCVAFNGSKFKQVIGECVLHNDLEKLQILEIP